MEPDPRGPCRICRGLDRRPCAFCGHKKLPAKKRSLKPAQQEPVTTLSMIDDPVLRDQVIRANMHGSLADAPVTLPGSRPQVDEAEVSRRKRMDFYGRLYNAMLKFRLRSTGYVGTYRGERVVICKEVHADSQFITVLVGEVRTVAFKSEVTDIRKNAADEMVLKLIGDPMSPGARPYVPYYKEKKNEVG